MNEFCFAVMPSAVNWGWRVLALAEAHFDVVVMLNNNNVAYPNDPFPNRLYVGAKRVVPFSGRGDLQTLSDFHRQHRCHLAGYVGYDVKNQLEALHSRHPDNLGFPDCWFFEPLYILDFDANSLLVSTNEPDAGPWETWMEEFIDLPFRTDFGLAYSQTGVGKATVQAQVSQVEYEAVVRQIRQLIEDGDVYELNYCMAFFAEQINLSPVAAYQALCARSPMPFSTFLKQGSRFVLGASPERFLKKLGSRLISQPIKGTIRRGISPEEDDALRTELRTSEKEQAENLMIVDLVRNDLARSAEVGSVHVDELFGIYTFQQLHQMISTVSATARPDASLADMLGNAFPMGSMTGAPKIRAMERIDELEATRRGVYSGAIGYITPDGDFDFNVVIRSLFYNADTRYASFSVGSAITYDADPATEYAECLLKAKAMREVLTSPPFPQSRLSAN